LSSYTTGGFSKKAKPIEVKPYFRYVFSANLSVLETIKKGRVSAKNVTLGVHLLAWIIVFITGQWPVIGPVAECNTVVVFASVYRFRFVILLLKVFFVLMYSRIVNQFPNHSHFLYS
jgi:hypothetical protein